MTGAGLRLFVVVRVFGVSVLHNWARACWGRSRLLAYTTTVNTITHAHTYRLDKRKKERNRHIYGYIKCIYIYMYI